MRSSRAAGDYPLGMHHPFEDLDAADYALPEELAGRLLTPALVIDSARVRWNIERVLERLGGDPGRWRPHVKTTKIPEVWRLLVEAGVRQFKCATTREADELLSTLEECGVRGDVLLAYPLRPPALERLGQVADAHPDSCVSVLCEDPEVVPEIPSGVGVFVDLNPGMDRTGLPPGSIDQIREVVTAAGPRLRGLHWYDGHRYEADQGLRRSRVHSGYADLVALMGAVDLPDSLEVITAGTPAFLAAAERGPLQEVKGVTHRLSPGTVVFHDARSAEQNPDLDLRPAAVVLARVVSHPGPARVTCDAGSKSVAAEAGDPIARVIGHPELEAETPSEEHLPLRVTSGERPARGTILSLAPYHVCPTVNLAEEALWLEDGEARVVRVTARAHELLVPRSS